MTIRYDDGSVTAAWAIYRDFRERGQSGEYAFRQAIRRLITVEPINGAMVPVADVIAEPCKGCGKRPFDFMIGLGELVGDADGTP